MDRLTGGENDSFVIYDRTKNIDAVRRLLGQSSVTATSAFNRIEDKDALEMSREYFI